MHFKSVFDAHCMQKVCNRRVTLILNIITKDIIQMNPMFNLNANFWEKRLNYGKVGDTDNGGRITPVKVGA